MVKGYQGRPPSCRPRGGWRPDYSVIEGLFEASPQMYKGFNILAGKALYLALFDRRTARRLHVMGRSMKKCGHKNWGGGGQR